MKQNKYKRPAALRGLGQLALFLFIPALFSNTHAQTLPPNIDFSAGNLSNWLCYTGTAITGTPATGTSFSSPVAGFVAAQHIITSGTGLDPVGGYPVVAPGGGAHSIRIGDSNVGAGAARVRYNVHVPVGSIKYSLQTMYAVSFQDPAHRAEENPTFQVIAYDSATGAIIPSANNLFIAGYNMPGFVVPLGGEPYLPWKAGTVNMGGMGGRTVTLEVTALDCSLGGHWGYGYFDITGFSNYLAPVVSNCNLAAHTIKFKAPPGYKYYQWFDQSYSTALNSATDTNTSITLPLPATQQYYNLVLIPYSSLGIPDTIRTTLLSPGFSVQASGAGVCATSGVPVPLTTTITGTATGLKYRWYNDTSSLSALNIPNPIATPMHISHYMVAVTDTNGCTALDTLTLLTGSYHVNAGADRTTCLGTSVSLNAIVTPTSSAYTYSWTPSGNLSSTSVANPVFMPPVAGTSQIVLRVDSGACSVYDTLTVRTLTDSFTVTSAIACQGQSLTLNVTGDTSFTYSWSPSTRLTFATPATNAGNQHPVFAADTTTTFTITAQYPGCPSITKNLTATVEPMPLVSLPADTMYKNIAYTLGIGTSVAPASFAAYNYSWTSNAYIDSPYSANINYSGVSDTMLYITVTTPHGCSGTDSVYIVVNSMSAMRVANAFVPGSAYNGTFRVLKIDPGFTFRSMRIYNRWGTKLFESNNMNSGWNGSFNGSTSPMGVYIYTLEAVSSNGQTVRQQGNLTLLH